MNAQEKSAKKWIKYFTIFSLLNFSLLIIVNYVVDPFNIFHTHFLKYKVQENERFVKIEYLEKNHNKFNGYLFGSSRIGTTDPKVVEQYIPNSKFYNMELSSANLYEYNLHLKYFIKKKYPINYLYLQLDLEDIQYYGQSELDVLSKPHPYTVGDSLPLYYFQYLTGFFPINIQEKIKDNLSHHQEVEHNLTNGIWSVPNKEREISENCEEYVQNVRNFNTKHYRVLQYGKKNQNIKAIKEIVSLCKENHIKLYLFITPHNQNMMDTFYLDDCYSYLQDIAEITEYYDFSGYNSITTNNCNYYEASHYRPLVGKLIASKIFQDKKIAVPNDFGVWVTKSTIKRHIEELKKEYLKYDSTK